MRVTRNQSMEKITNQAWVLDLMCVGTETKDILDEVGIDYATLYRRRKEEGFRRAEKEAIRKCKRSMEWGMKFEALANETPIPVEEVECNCESSPCPYKYEEAPEYEIDWNYVGEIALLTATYFVGIIAFIIWVSVFAMIFSM